MASSGLLVLSFLLIFAFSEAALRRCYVCRSRGDLGTCKDPFTLNGTSLESTKGIKAIPCASGWCGKILEGGNIYKDDDYGIATQRLCLQRSPSDGEERCAYTVFHHKRVYMCFCTGDLCNAAATNYISWNMMIFIPALTILFHTILLK